jgi:site-specific recombinase XerD
MSTDPESATKIDLATTHWLRHTNCTCSVDRGMPIPVLWEILRHSNVSVTSVYLHAEIDAAFDSIRVLDH